jgi:alpha-galactosidase
MNWQSWSPLKQPLIKLPVRNFSPFRDIVASAKKPKQFKKKAPIVGICTWYRFGRQIRESNIMSFAKESLNFHPEIKYCLIDDGWCSWGDWHFPKLNIKEMSNKLNKLKLNTGLWLAPFLASKNSIIFKTHPEYFVRDSKGKLINGTKFSFFDNFLPNQKYILNFANPEAKKYIYDSIRLAVNKWNVTLLKLDFLYAPYFDSQLKDSSIPHNYLSDLFKWIKTEFPEVYLMVCGCPFEPAKYLADSIRISDDINVPHVYKFPLIKKIIHQRQFNMLLEKWQNCQPLSKYFHLDPDVFPLHSLSGFSDDQMTKLKRIFDQSSVKFYG